MSAFPEPPAASAREQNVPPQSRRPGPVRHAASVAVEGLRARPGAVAEFWARASASGTPLIEGEGATRTFTFLHRGEAEQVALIANKMADDSSYGEVLFERMPGTDVWALSLALDADWRGSYRIAVLDGRGPEIGAEEATLLERRRARARSVTPGERHAQLDAWFALQRHARRDPLAREQGPKESIASGPEAPARFPVDPSAPSGRIVAAGPGAWWHLPPVDPEPDGWDVLVLLDGERWIGDAAAVLDAMALSGALAPTATLLVGHGGMAERVAELTCNPALVERIRALLAAAPPEVGALTAHPARTTIAGQSLGGLSALYAQCIAPDRFGASISQSGSFWWPNPLGGEPAEWLTRAIAGADARLGRVHLEVGTGEWALIEPTRRLHAVLEGRCEALGYREFAGGHDSACWDASLPDALIALSGSGRRRVARSSRMSQAGFDGSARIGWWQHPRDPSSS